MSEQIVQCPGCSVKLKLKDDRVLSADAACPKCNTPLFKKTKPVSGPTAPSSGRSNPAAAPLRAAKPAPRRPAKEEFDEFEEEEAEDDFEEEVRPRKRSRSNRSSSGGIPGWAIGAGIGVLAVSVIVGVILLLPKGAANNVAQQPAAGTTPEAVPALPATGTATTQTGSPTGMSPGVPVNSTGVAAPALIPTPPVAGAGPLAKYQPKPDSLHFYEFKIESDFDKFVEKSSGSCMLTAQKSVTSGFSIRKESQEGSGTGFVVGSNGVVVTCAHVVDGAETIEVMLGGQTYPATVLHSDSTLDLAVIKVEANGLPVLSLANSDQLQLGEPLRVIGFPLSDLLGTGIKITQGSVSGIVDQDGQRTIQTDATINPGNSGGPVFNTRGEVVGIASAKLAGGAISQVGFCVPSSTLSGMLQRQGIGLAPSVPGQEMATPVLVQKVSPAVAFIKVKVGDNSQAQVGFTYSASLSTYRDMKGALITGLDLSTPLHESGTLSLTDCGKPVDVSDGNFAPIIMARLPLLPFVELSKSGQTDWTNHRDISILREEKTDRSRDRFNFYRELFPNQQPKIVAIQKASERDQFHVTTNNAQQLVLSRTYELKTTDGSEPGIHLTGTGTWTFDRAEGMPVASDLKGTYKVTVSGVTITVPYTVAVRRWTQAEMDKMKEGSVASQEKANDMLERIKKGLPLEESDATHVITSKSNSYESLAVSPNGKTVAFADNDNAIFVHDLATGKENDTKLGLDDLGDPSASTYSPDGKYLLVGGYKGVIRIWSVDDKGDLDIVGDYVGHSSEIQTIEVSPDNKTVISADQDKRVRAWSLVDQQEHFAIADLKETVVDIGVTPDRASGMLVDRDGLVSMFNLKDGKITSSQPVFKSHFGTVATISPDGMMLFIPASTRLNCFTLKSKTPPAVIDVGESINSIAYCQQTNEVIVGTSAKIHICDWKKQTRTAILSTGKKFSGSVDQLSISPDGRFIVTINSNNAISIFDRESKKSPVKDEKPGDEETSKDENPFK